MLRRAEAEFDVFVTADRNLPYQQDLDKLGIAIVILAARSTKLEDLQPLVSALRETLAAIKPDQVMCVPQV